MTVSSSQTCVNDRRSRRSVRLLAFWLLDESGGTRIRRSPAVIRAFPAPAGTQDADRGQDGDNGYEAPTLLRFSVHCRTP
jgi:hypothetical protein